ncbi:MAG TPA: hypothetical protein VIU61_26925 [Kofleriaceae bacterium]
MIRIGVLFLVACSSSTPSPPPQPPPQPAVEIDAAPAPPVEAVVDAAVAVDAPLPDAGPAPIACKTDDDCWIDDAGTLVERPKAKRGKKLKPCKDSSRLPICKQNVCAINAYKC